MQKMTIAVLAAFLSVAVAGAYASDSKGAMNKSDTGTTKSEKGMAKKDSATTRDDEKKKKKDKKK